MCASDYDDVVHDVVAEVMAQLPDAETNLLSSAIAALRHGEVALAATFTLGTAYAAPDVRRRRFLEFLFSTYLTHVNEHTAYSRKVLTIV
jgi:hypothetical protein